MLPQDSLFDACYKCHVSVSAADIIKCDACEAPYHKECADKIDGTEEWSCTKCQAKKSASKPKSLRSHKGSSVSSKSSTSSYRIELHMKLLEEKQKLFEEQCKEKELQLKEKQRLQNELMESKINLLKESYHEPIAEVEVIDSVNDKVTKRFSDVHFKSKATNSSR